ncbi:hypothetical protein LINPERPRIM_LOCUS20814, partial [Linum perenne]
MNRGQKNKDNVVEPQSATTPILQGSPGKRTVKTSRGDVARRSSQNILTTKQNKFVDFMTSKRRLPEDIKVCVFPERGNTVAGFKMHSFNPRDRINLALLSSCGHMCNREHIAARGHLTRFIF